MNRNVVVTGGSTGIGRAMAEAFLAEGDRVVFTARGEERAQGFLKERDEDVRQGRLFYLNADVADAGDAEKLVAFTKEKLGGCEILINNAAIFIGGQVHNNTAEEFDRLFSVDVRGVFLASKALLPMMLDKRKGNIVMIASLAGMRGGYNMSLYCAAKAAVINMARSMALDYMEYGIRVNTICPSATETDMFLGGNDETSIGMFEKNNPAHRLGKPSDIANAAVSMVDDKNAYMTAQTIAVDGGLSSWNGEPRQDQEKVRSEG